MPLTRLSLSLVASAFTFILFGMLFGNMPLIYIGTMPMIFLIMVLVLGQIETVELKPLNEVLEVYKDDVVELQRTVSCRGGLGFIVLYEEVPSHFELVEGENLQIHFKSLKDLEIDFSFKVRCTRRGVYEIANVDYNVRHVLEVASPRKGSLPVNQSIVVKSRYYKLKRIREHQQRSFLPMPAEAQIRMGVTTTNFKELREYTVGDSYKQINWKATARSILTAAGVPIVNEYEKEGRRVVWIFLNSSQRMAQGNSISNSFEYAIQAALSLAEFYLDRQCMVGFSVYNDDAVLLTKQYSKQFLQQLYKGQSTPVLPDLASSHQLITVDQEHAKLTDLSWARQYNLFPDTGRKQLYKIRRILQGAGLRVSGYNLRQTLKITRGHLKSTNPLFIVITTIHPDKIMSLQEDIRELQRYVKQTRTSRKNLILVNISGYMLSSRDEPEQEASHILKFEERELLHSVLPESATVINWDPTEFSFTNVLLSKVKTR